MSTASKFIARKDRQTDTHTHTHTYTTKTLPLPHTRGGNKYNSSSANTFQASVNYVLNGMFRATVLWNLLRHFWVEIFRLKLHVYS